LKLASSFGFTDNIETQLRVVSNLFHYLLRKWQLTQQCIIKIITI